MTSHDQLSHYPEGINEAPIVAVPVATPNAVPAATPDAVPTVVPHAVHHVACGGVHAVDHGGARVVARCRARGGSHVAAPGVALGGVDPSVAPSVTPIGGLAPIDPIGGPVTPPPCIDIDALFVFAK